MIYRQGSRYQTTSNFDVVSFWTVRKFTKFQNARAEPFCQLNFFSGTFSLLSP